MLNGAHCLLYSTHPDQDRAFLRDVLGLPHVDVGEGWLIFGLPPAEIAVHPAEDNELRELYLMCDDIQAFVAQMAASGIACSPVSDQGYGLVIELTLPGGGKLGVYEPRHARPAPFTARGGGARKQAARKGASKVGRGKTAKRSGKRPATKVARKQGSGPGARKAAKRGGRSAGKNTSKGSARKRR